MKISALKIEVVPHYSAGRQPLLQMEIRDFDGIIHTSVVPISEDDFVCQFDEMIEVCRRSVHGLIKAHKKKANR